MLEAVVYESDFLKSPFVEEVLMMFIGMPFL